MPAPSTDRNLLFAVLALQNDLVGRDALVEGMNALAIAKDRPLGELLAERGAMSEEDRRLLDALIDRQVAKHGSPEKTLGTMEYSSSVRRALSQIQDADVQASLADAARTGAYVPADSTRTGPSASANQSGHRYRILRPHARGGLGEVFVAQDEELNREVALKEIREQHADNDASRGRFVAEAEITGRLEHPGIVPVYGLGAYDDGRPFYAMRFIRGDNLQAAIKRFHEAHPLQRVGFASVEFRQLLGRFVDVCEAIAYAHSRGVLHRDLKPGNIMLGKYGETLVVDWGLAKIVGRRDDNDVVESMMAPVSGSGSFETVAGAAIGTPAYMSPEQADGRLDDLGPATDIYSLGATLYAVLSSRPPVTGATADEVLDRVRRGEIAPANAGVPAGLAAVCAKAMALRSAGRYATAQALATDIEHWLADEPVAAMAEPVTVRLRRWARKHPGPVAGLAAALMMGVVGLGAGLYFVNAERARTELARAGEEKQRIEADRQTVIARTNEQAATDRREETEAVLKFVEGRVFAAARPETQAGGLGREVSLKRAVQAALPLVAEGFKDRPLIEARLRMTMGTSFAYLGDAEVAESQYQNAYKLYAATLGPDHPDTLKSINSHATSYVILGRAADALPLHEQVLNLRRSKLGINHHDTMRSMVGLATCYMTLGRFADALTLYEQTLELQEAKFGPGHPETIPTMGNLAVAYAALGRATDALALREKAIELIKARMGPDHPDALMYMNNLASSYAQLGRAADALALREKTLELRRAKLGPDHPDTLSSMNNLSNSYESLGRAADALALRETTLKLRKIKQGLDHPETLAGMHNLAVSYFTLGRIQEAVSLFEETLRLKKHKLGPDHPDTLMTMTNLGEVYARVGRAADALTIHEEALELKKVKLGPDHPATLLSMAHLANHYTELARLDDALALVDDALRRASGRPGVDPGVVPNLVNTRRQIFAKRKDAAGCRSTAEIWENLKRTDAGSLYDAATFRAVSAAIVKLDPKTPGADATRLATDEADKAMHWLQQAVAAGYKDVAHLKKDPDLDALRGRDDFKALLAELAAKQPPAKK